MFGPVRGQHVRWAKKLAAVAIPAACAASNLSVADVRFLVVCTTTGFLSYSACHTPHTLALGLPAHTVAKYVTKPEPFGIASVRPGTTRTRCASASASRRSCASCKRA